MDLDAAAVAETHVSTVFFAGRRAYKLLKPVTTAFLDHANTSQRLASAQRELDLNRRMAPDVYLGTADVTEGDRVVDRMIVMRRLDPARKLTRRLHEPSRSDDLRSVARTIAAFHAGLEALPPSVEGAHPRSMETLWNANIEELLALAPEHIDGGAVTHAADLGQRYLEGRRRLFKERAAAGLVRDGHGDLLAEDIFCLDDGPRILDCLAFRDDLRVGDVLLDVAFLVMDVHRLAGPAAAIELMTSYQDFSNEHHPSSLAHFYVAYRALVRAKVAALTDMGGVEVAEPDTARVHLALALDHLRRAEVKLVLVGGAPGTGKSTVANGLCDRFGWACLSTDELRKDLLGVAHDDHRIAQTDQGIYQPEITLRTYAELLREAGELLDRGESVVLDASWTVAEHRAQAADLAADHGASLVELECALDPAVARERIARRLASPFAVSDATPEVADALRGRRDPWPTAVRIDTLTPPTEVAAEAAAAVAHHTRDARTARVRP